MIEFGARPLTSAAILAGLSGQNVGANSFTGNAGGYLGLSSRFFLRSTLDGEVSIRNAAETLAASLVVEANNTLGMRSGINQQTFRLYNTFTDASNYERAALGWSSNVFEVGTMAAGTGSNRTLRLNGAGTIIDLTANDVQVYRNGTSAGTILGVYSTGLTATALLHTRLAPSINQASGTYTILDINPTETAIGAGPHFLLRGRIGAGGNVFSVDRTGIISSAAGFASGLRFAGSTQLLDIGDGLLGISDSGLNGAAIRLTERADPSAPSGNNAYFYCRDGGSGKTQLVVRFPTGAIQVIATEP
jgi:hypothetical protein